MDIKKRVTDFCEQENIKFSFGTEDGFTWITIYGDKISPKEYDVFSQKLADTMGVDFYFHSAGIDSIEGAVDFNFYKNQKYTDTGRDICAYGTQFVSTPSVAKKTMKK